MGCAALTCGRHCAARAHEPVSGLQQVGGAYRQPGGDNRSLCRALGRKGRCRVPLQHTLRRGQEGPHSVGGGEGHPDAEHTSHTRVGSGRLRDPLGRGGRGARASVNSTGQWVPGRCQDRQPDPKTTHAQSSRGGSEGGRRSPARKSKTISRRRRRRRRCNRRRSRRRRRRTRRRRRRNMKKNTKKKQKNT